MTTTSTFQGMSTGAKPSSRVLAPPGGGSSNIFGGSNEDSSPGKRSNPQNVNKGDNNIFGTGEAVVPGTSPGKRHNRDNVNCGNNDIFNREQHAAAAQPRSRAPRSEYNPITGEMYEKPAEKTEEQQQQEAEEERKKAAAEQQEPQAGPHIPQPSTRVSQPPGGRSTKLW